MFSSSPLPYGDFFRVGYSDNYVKPASSVE
jgi:hypothetical protein